KGGGQRAIEFGKGRVVGNSGGFEFEEMVGNGFGCRFDKRPRCCRQFLPVIGQRGPLSASRVQERCVETRTPLVAARGGGWTIVAGSSRSHCVVCLHWFPPVGGAQKRHRAGGETPARWNPGQVPSFKTQQITPWVKPLVPWQPRHG